jgi:Uma2 family endonuclease
MAYESGSSFMTYEQFMALPEGRYELFDGVLYEPPPPSYDHQDILANLYLAVGGFLKAHRALGKALFAPFGVVLRREPRPLVVEPDLVFIAAAHLDRIVNGCLEGPPDLAVEVISPSNSRNDTVRKREIYERFGVREYWLVWPTDRQIDVFVLGGNGTYGEHRSYGCGDRLETPLLPGLAIDVGEVFEG